MASPSSAVLTLCAGHGALSTCSCLSLRSCSRWLTRSSGPRVDADGPRRTWRAAVIEADPVSTRLSEGHHEAATATEDSHTETNCLRPDRHRFLRTICGLLTPKPPLTCANAPIQTLKRNMCPNFADLRRCRRHAV